MRRQLRLPKQVDFLGKKFTVDNSEKSKLLLLLHKLGKNKIESKTLNKTVKCYVKKLKQEFDFNTLTVLVKLFVLDNTLKNLDIPLFDLSKNETYKYAQLDKFFSKEPPIYDHDGFTCGMESLFFLLMTAAGLDEDEFKKRLRDVQESFVAENLIILLSHLDMLEAWFANQNVFWQTNLSIFNAKNLFRYRPRNKLRVEELFPSTEELIKVLNNENYSLPVTVDIKKLHNDLLWIDYKNKKPDIEIYNEDYLLKGSLLFETVEKAKINKQLITNLFFTLIDNGIDYEIKMIADKTIFFVKFFGRIIAVVPDGVMIRMFITPEVEGAGFLGLELNDDTDHVNILMLISSLFMNAVRTKPVNSIAEFVELKRPIYEQRDIFILNFYTILRILLRNYINDNDNKNEICIKVNDTFWRFVLNKSSIEIYKNRMFLISLSNKLTISNIAHIVGCLLDYKDEIVRFSEFFVRSPSLYFC